MDSLEEPFLSLWIMKIWQQPRSYACKWHKSLPLFIYLFIYLLIYWFIYLFWKCNFQNMLLQYYYLDDFSVWLTNVSLWLQFMQRCGLAYRWFSFLPCFGNFRDLIPLCICKLILFYHTVLTYFLLMSRKRSD